MPEGNLREVEDLRQTQYHIKQILFWIQEKCNTIWRIEGNIGLDTEKLRNIS